MYKTFHPKPFLSHLLSTDNWIYMSSASRMPENDTAKAYHYAQAAAITVSFSQLAQKGVIWALMSCLQSNSESLTVEKGVF